MTTEAIRTLIQRLDREIWLLTARSGARRGGLAATFVNQASIVPEMPRVLVGVARHHHTWELIEESGAFALHLLRQDQLPRVWQFGLRSARDIDKFEGLEVDEGVTGAPILRDAAGWLECRVEEGLDAGDRTIWLAEVVHGNWSEDVPVLTVRQMVERAPPERLRELGEQMERAAATDAAAIRAWRESRQRGSSD